MNIVKQCQDARIQNPSREGNAIDIIAKRKQDTRNEASTDKQRIC